MKTTVKVVRKSFRNQGFGKKIVLLGLLPSLFLLSSFSYLQVSEERTSLMDKSNSAYRDLFNKMRVDGIDIHRFSLREMESNHHVEDEPEIYPVLAGPAIGKKRNRDAKCGVKEFMKELGRKAPMLTNSVLKFLGVGVRPSENDPGNILGTLTAIIQNTMKNLDNCPGRIWFKDELARGKTIENAKNGRKLTIPINQGNNYVAMNSLFYLVIYDHDKDRRGNRDDRMLYVLLNPTMLLSNDVRGINNLNPNFPGVIKFRRVNQPNNRAKIKFMIPSVHGDDDGNPNSPDWSFDLNITCL